MLTYCQDMYFCIDLAIFPISDREQNRSIKLIIFASEKYHI